MIDWRILSCVSLFWLGYVALLSTVPHLWPPDPTLPNVAAATGYNTNVAFLIAALWSLAGLLLFGLAFERGRLARPPALPAGGATLERGRILELAAAFVLFAALYWPTFLARHGPYMEDKYLLAVLARMQCGELPFRDFEFLYGPLTIYPAHYWMAVFSFSMKSYYAFLAVLEGALFASVLWMLQRHLPDRRWRYLAFALLLPFLFDTLLGLNWIGWRRMLAVFVIAIVAARPTDARAVLAAGAISGLQIAYSHEYGAVGLVSALAIYAAMLLGPERRATLLSAMGLVASAVGVWLAASLAVTGATFPDYLITTVAIMERAARLGLGNFAFYWTLNSLALFGVLSLAVVAVGAGLFRLGRERMAEGDRLMLGALVFAVITLRLGLQRADLWHMGTPMLALVVAFVAGAPRRLFVLGPAGVRVAWALIVICAATTLVGILPTGSYYASGLWRGAIDVVTGVPPGGPIASRVGSVEAERTAPNPDYVGLAAYLADGANAGRPVVFYGEHHYWRYPNAGVCPSGPLPAPNLSALYEVMSEDGASPLQEYLEKNPDAYVVIQDAAYRQLFEGTPTDYEPATTMTQRLAQWLSSVHFAQKWIQYGIQDEVWRRAAGMTLAAQYQRVAQFGPVVVLARRSEGDTTSGSPP